MSGKVPGAVGRGEIVIRIYCMKKIYFQLKNVRKLIQGTLCLILQVKKSSYGDGCLRSPHRLVIVGEIIRPRPPIPISHITLLFDIFVAVTVVATM